MKVTLETKVHVDIERWTNGVGGTVSGRDIWNKIQSTFMDEFSAVRVVKETPVLMRMPELELDLDNHEAIITASLLVNIKSSAWAEEWDTDGMNASEVRDQIAGAAEDIILDHLSDKGVVEASVRKAFK